MLKSGRFRFDAGIYEYARRFRHEIGLDALIGKFIGQICHEGSFPAAGAAGRDQYINFLFHFVFKV